MRLPIAVAPTLLILLALPVACTTSRAAWQPCVLPLPDAGTDAEAGSGGDDGGASGDDGGASGDDGGDGAAAMAESPPALPDCPAPLSCESFSAPGPDGLCHGVTPACVLVCQTTADCAPLGKNSVCLPSCTRADSGTGNFISVCTPYQ